MQPTSRVASVPPRRRATESDERPSEELRVELRAYPEVVWTDPIGVHQITIAGPIVLGSARRVGLRITDPAVSRIHAELDVREGQVWIRDLGSRNGTFVNGVRVDASLVAAGGRIRVGDTILSVHAATLLTPVEVWPETTFHSLVGESAATRELFARTKRLARTDATTLVRGEAGAGKQSLARGLHAASARCPRFKPCSSSTASDALFSLGSAP